MSLRKLLSQRLLTTRLFLHAETQCCCRRKYSLQLIPMGKFHEPNTETEAYQPGQMFFHKVFPYRGVVLHPWLARVDDRSQKDRTSRSERKTQLYYQVLVDETDSQHVRVENLSVTFRPPENGNRYSLFSQIYSIRGIDYVAHQDIMPYTVTEDAKPIQHELFDKFLTPVPDSDKSTRYVAKDILRSFQEANHPWLRLSDVYKQTTENIRVTVIPFYMGNQEVYNKDLEVYNKYWWRYCIRIENLGEDTVQLRDRELKTFSNNNSMETLHGRGVTGLEPKLSKDSPAFQYSSHITLECPAGYMWGVYTFEREDGSKFKCNIPAFNLQKVEVNLHDSNNDLKG
ncbi:polymerase delta-interacting protein 2-like [Mercenaria mercenaria]|uniref:polymerase delta-interacting protein 2-like n=1 Tax=Mercenaria mercenaria TaxID=6596 RepID=UPI00234F93D0|nr:polymerase delta-interacting protein 2-like [Mercenaria mercenaria]